MENKSVIINRFKKKYKEIDFSEFQEIYFKEKNTSVLESTFVLWEKNKNLFGFYYLEIEKDKNGGLREEAFEVIKVFVSLGEFNSFLINNEIKNNDFINVLTKKTIKITNDDLKNLFDNKECEFKVSKNKI